MSGKPKAVKPIGKPEGEKYEGTKPIGRPDPEKDIGLSHLVCLRGEMS